MARQRLSIPALSMTLNLASEAISTKGSATYGSPSRFVVIAAERGSENPCDLIRRVMPATGNQELGLSAIRYTELVHGVYRGGSEIKRAFSRQVLDDLTRHLPIYPYTAETAELVVRIDADQKGIGLTVPYIDLMTGPTALSLGFSILTVNVRHFRLIPGLNVIPF